MKKIINKMLYDTDTDTEIGGNGYRTPNDFRHYFERLYRRSNGEYYLHGEGGPLSKYSVSAGTNEISGSEKIIPLTPVEARDWAADNLDVDDYIMEFGAPDESDDYVALTANISTAAYDRLMNDATSAGVTISDYIERLVMQS